MPELEVPDCQNSRRLFTLFLHWPHRGLRVTVEHGARYEAQLLGAERCRGDGCDSFAKHLEWFGCIILLPYLVIPSFGCYFCVLA